MGKESDRTVLRGASEYDLILFFRASWISRFVSCANSFELVRPGVFNEAVVEAGKRQGVSAARCVQHLTIKDVSDMLENKGRQTFLS